MDSSLQNSSVTAQSVIEKIKSLSDNASNKMINTTSSLSERTPDISPNFEDSSDSFFGSAIRYIAIFCLAGFLILAVLNSLKILPLSLGEFLNPYTLFEKQGIKELKKERQKQAQLATGLDGSQDKSYNIPQVKKIAQRPEVSAPTQLPQRGNPIPRPDRTGSRTQAVRASKSGYCYVGEDRGFRSCVPVKSGDKCMSGDIFPTQAVCINPNLRA
jgi:hypothetical protein